MIFNFVECVSSFISYKYPLTLWNSINQRFSAMHGTKVVGQTFVFRMTRIRNSIKSNKVRNMRCEESIRQMNLEWPSSVLPSIIIWNELKCDADGKFWILQQENNKKGPSCIKWCSRLGRQSGMLCSTITISVLIRKQRTRTTISIKRAIEQQANY